MINNPKIVVIGGGTGLPVILNGLRKKNVDITAIVTSADDGGSSGIIRDYINVVPPGDIRNVMMSLTNLPKIYKDIFQYRFNSDDSFFSGHTIGNLIIAALSEMKNNNIFDAIQILSKLMKVQGKVYPASNVPLILNARFYDNTVLSGESEITSTGKKIKNVWVTTVNGSIPQAVPEVVNSILKADQIVLGPGSLFTSILPNLMIENVGNAILKSSAEVIYICNIMTQKGETEHFTDADHVRVLHQHLKHKFINTVIVNNNFTYNRNNKLKSNDDYMEPVKNDFLGLKKEGCRIIANNFLDYQDNGIFHNGYIISRELMNLL